MEKNGYTLGHHHITTQDGYVLGLHHFLHPAKTCTECNEQTTPKPILLMHGLSSSSLNFILYPDVSAGNNMFQLVLILETYTKIN